MTEERIRLANELSASEVVYTDIKKNSYGSNQIFVNYGPNAEKLWVQTPKMHIQFGLSTPMNQKEGQESYYLEPQFDREPTPKQHQLQKFFDDLDKKMLADGLKNAKEWFPKIKKPSKAVIEAKYYSMLKRYRDKETGEFTGKYPDRIKFKILPGKTKVYDQNRQQVDFREAIVPGCKVIAVVCPNKIYFTSSNYGMSWYVFQIQVFPPDRLDGFCILPEEVEVEDVASGMVSESSDVTMTNASTGANTQAPESDQMKDVEMTDA